MRLNQIPGVAALLIAASSIAIPACSSSGSAKGDQPIDKNAPVVFDSVRKVAIDSLAKKINDLSSTRNLNAKKIPYPVYNPNDSIGYLLTDDHHARLSMNTHPDSNIIWPYFWVYDGELILMRLRKATRTPEERSASETVVYFEKGKIVYCNERKKVLSEGEIPGAVQSEPFVKSQRTYGDIEQESFRYWLELTNEMKKQNVLPAWIKQ